MAEKRNTTLENSFENRHTFIMDYVHMPSLRAEVKQLADHWKLIAFRQHIKRRRAVLPSSSSRSALGTLQAAAVPLREKRLRILEMVKSQRDPEVFPVPSVEFNVARFLRQDEDCRDFKKLLTHIMDDYTKVLNRVERQKQLELQLYMKRLITYMQTKHCSSCHHNVNIPVKYTELVKSNETGDKNMAILMKIETDEGSQRDEAVVKYFFAVLHRLR